VDGVFLFVFRESVGNDMKKERCRWAVKKTPRLVKTRRFEHGENTFSG